jgi:hypothetical protein
MTPQRIQLKRTGQWAFGHSDQARCLTCRLPITSRPVECSEPKHLEHHVRRRAKNNLYRRRRRAEARLRGEVYRSGTPEAKKAQSKRQYKKLRATILAALGSKCLRCGFSDGRALQVHHPEGGGASERKHLGWRYFYRLSKLSALELQERFELLCANCHAIEHAEGK